ncbi:MAG TPA: hypothetical protein VER58_06830 [Thermoanaerobaculia bacterium]|nr:hypothetical protein [Thermoanaerobaculia bacterium]
MTIEQEALGSNPKPRVIGRSVRIVLGAVLLYFFVKIIFQISASPGGFLAGRAGWSVPGGDWWVAALICLWVLPTVVNGGFGGKWGEWARGVYIILAGAAIFWDRIAHGGLWAAPLAWLVLLLILYVLAHSGISFLVAGIAATPG